MLLRSHIQRMVGSNVHAHYSTVPTFFFTLARTLMYAHTHVKCTYPCTFLYMYMYMYVVVHEYVHTQYKMKTKVTCVQTNTNRGIAQKQKNVD